MRETAPLRNPSTTCTTSTSRPWSSSGGAGSVIALLAARLTAAALYEDPDAAASAAGSPTPARVAGPRSRPSRKACPPTSSTSALYERFQLARRGRLRRPHPLCDAKAVRRPRREADGVTETAPARADALRLFGISGDLGRKKLFGALYNLQKRGRLGVPVIGVASSAWTDEDLRQHARDALVRGRRRSRPGGAGRAAAAAALRRRRLPRPGHLPTGGRGGGRGPARGLLPRDPARLFRRRDGGPGVGRPHRPRAGGGGEALRPRLGSAQELNRLLRSHFPEEAIFRIDTSSARSRSRT